jgi:hypothetical protein
LLFKRHLARVFLDKPQANLERARRNWLRMAAEAEENSKDRRRLGGVAATRPQ